MIQDKLNTIVIKMWGHEVGAMILEEQDCAVFEYTAAMRDSSLDVSPLVMPVQSGEVNQYANSVNASTYSFPQLNPMSFKGLPGLLADSLPGDFSIGMLDEYRARQGYSQDQLNSVEILLSLGSCAMGALEFLSPTNYSSDDVIVDELDKVVPVKIEDLLISLRSVTQDRG